MKSIQRTNRACAFLNAIMMQEFGANGTMLILVQSTSIFWCLFVTKDVLNARVYVRLLSMIVTASLVSGVSDRVQ